jgi:hypothetical protein
MSSAPLVRRIALLVAIVFTVIATTPAAAGLCAPPPPNMIAWWPLDEQTGATVVTDIVGGNNGTPVPGPIGPPDPSTRPAPTTPPPPSITPPAMVGGALFFYGQGPQGFVQVPSAAPLNIGTGDFTIDAWAYPVQVGAGLIQPIVDKLDLGAKIGYSLHITSPSISNNARLEFVWGNGSFVTTVQSMPLQLNLWAV